MRIVRSALLALCLVSLGLPSCSASSDDGTSAATDSVTKTVGPSGGTIVVDGATVTIPAGALDKELAITITSKGTVPEGYEAVSKVFECGPTGTNFTAGVTMAMPFTDDGKGPLTMFWSAGGDPTFKDIGGKPDGAMFAATTMHFSSGFVGRKK